MSFQKSRKKLEKVATQRALHFGNVLNEKDGRYHSVSPTAYYYVTGNNYNNKDCVKFRQLSTQMHTDTSSERALIEIEVKKMCKNVHFLNSYFTAFYFHEAKESFFRKLNCGEIQQEMNDFKIKKIIKLLKKWELLSQNEHYKLSNAEKRIAEKNYNSM